jgi:hypothetical protein
VITPQNAQMPTTAGTEKQAAIPATPILLPTPTATALFPANPSISTTSPTVSITVPASAGTVTFSLVVTDNLGAKSAPAYATVTVQAPPIAVLTASPATATEGGPIQLSGSASTSSGSIANYLFSLVPAAP